MFSFFRRKKNKETEVASAVPVTEASQDNATVPSSEPHPVNHEETSLAQPPLTLPSSTGKQESVLGQPSLVEGTASQTRGQEENQSLEQVSTPQPVVEEQSTKNQIAQEQIKPVAETLLSEEQTTTAVANDQPVANQTVETKSGVETGLAENQAEKSIAGEPSTANQSAEVQTKPVAEKHPDQSTNSDLTAVQKVTQQEQQDRLATIEPAPKKSWFDRLKSGLSKTGSNISHLFVGVKIDEALFEDLETALLMADAGVEATDSLLKQLRLAIKKEHLQDPTQVKEALKRLLTAHLKPLEKPFMLPEDGTSVVMLAGVNGAGKTTTIGKLAHHFQAGGAKVLLAAGDTFRAAAREQLIEWGARNNVSVIAQEGGDPAAVAFDAVNAGNARGVNVVMVDTAGRLPTQLHLMEELKKIKRVIKKADEQAPHEVLLVVDGNTGQNALMQIKAFDAAIDLTGLIVTKLDGTAKGGILAAVAAGSQGVRPVPVYWIGVGESLYDLQPFNAQEFVDALLGEV